MEGGGLLRSSATKYVCQYCKKKVSPKNFISDGKLIMKDGCEPRFFNICKKCFDEKTNKYAKMIEKYGTCCIVGDEKDGLD